jgi:hypothetical protein
MIPMDALISKLVECRAKYEAAVKREAEAQTAFSAASKAADEATQHRHLMQSDLAQVIEDIKKAAF